MAKKKSKGGGGGGADDAADRKRHEQPLQAVLLADDWQFVHSMGGGSLAAAAAATGYPFHPLALDRPKVLSPLLNVTLLDYTVNYLAVQGVQELFVVCVTEAVEDYLTNNERSAPQQREPTMKITVIRDSTVTNAGDALRELDKRNVIQSDPFILLHGDCVTNVDLSRAIQAHKDRHVADSSAILTLLLKPVGATAVASGDDAVATNHYAQIRSATEDLVIGLDPAMDNRILLYDDNSTSRSATVPCSFFANHCVELEIRTDLLDVGLDLCSPDVLARFSDEFDYRDIRREFVANSVAEEEEGLQNKLYAHILPTASYAARVHDARTYHVIARDVLRRYVYPTVPDNPPSRYGIPSRSSSSTTLTEQQQQQHYSMQRHYMYYETSGTTKIGRSSVVTGPGMMGAHCWVGEQCQIQSSVLSSHCHIANQCTIADSHLWENVRVGQGATIRQSILAANVIVHEGAVIPTGCIIGAGCVIGANVHLPEYTRLTCCSTEHLDDDLDDDWDDDDESLESSNESSLSSGKAHADKVGIADADAPVHPQEAQVASDTDVVGPDGKGRVWRAPEGDDDDDDEEIDTENVVPIDEVLKSQCIGFHPQKFFAERMKRQKEDDDSLSVDAALDNPALDGDDGDYGDASVTFGESPIASSHPSLIIGRQEGVDVVKELKIICLEFEAGISPIENLAIELNSYKFSQNASYSDCTMAAMLAILEKMNITTGISDGKLVAEFKFYLDQWAPLLQKMSIGLDEEKAIVLALERCAVMEDGDEAARERSKVLSSGTSFRLLLQMLHDQEIVSEEAVLAWAADRKEEDGEKDSPQGRLFRMQPVQDFLEWLDEESDDDDGDDDDESDEGEDE